MSLFIHTDSLVKTVINAWKSGDRIPRRLLIAGGVTFASFALAATLGDFGFIDKKIATVLTLYSGALSAVCVFSAAVHQFIVEEKIREGKIATIEKKIEAHPERPQLAWDLARGKLENYLDRNLSQVRSIYWLTVIVMICGFSAIMYGLFQAFQQPDKLPVSIVAAASGVLVSFIGGSFLLIYRSILGQSKEYVSVLERINAVGMAVQVIASIPDTSAELKNSSTAELAKQLLGLYAARIQQQVQIDLDQKST
jgi:hypothetical protein